MSLINYAAHRAVIEQLYEDICTVQIYDESDKDPVTRITKGRWVATAVNQPCFLHIETPAQSQGTETISGVEQGVTVLIAPEINVPEGSRMIITKKGQTRTYKAAGLSSVEGSHQEIPLELVKNV